MDASSFAFCSVLATTLPIYLLEVDLVNVPVPVWVQYILGTGIPFNASTGNVLCRYDVGPVLVSARYITGTGIKWCPYRYWHFCTFV
jgi:hypothetical protein